METDFQRVGAESNASMGDAFELAAMRFWARNGLELSRNFVLPVGVGELKKPRRFDLGSASPSVIVECKSHTWTGSGNIPSAKITVWNESMFYFHIAPKNFRKIFFVQRDYCARRKLTLAEYYVRNNRHLIPSGVELWEFTFDSGIGMQIPIGKSDHGSLTRT